MPGDKIYFASDFHLGAPNFEASLERERRIIRWLDSIKHDAKAIYLMGDIFDFWHEYQTVIPKGFSRFQGKLAELADAGIELNIFTGNHDMWMRDYFPKEFGANVYHEPQIVQLNGKTFYLAHGDGLVPEEKTYNVLKKVFGNKFFQFLFQWLHPDIGMRIAQTWSKESRKGHSEPEVFLGEDKEYLIQFAQKKLDEEPIDYFIFGHRHLPIEYQLNEAGSTYINLGEWINQNHYAVFDGESVQLLPFND